MSKDVKYIKDGWYFWDEIGEPIGPYKDEWSAELVLSAYCFNYLDGCKFLYLNLTKFLAYRRK